MHDRRGPQGYDSKAYSSGRDTKREWKGERPPAQQDRAHHAGQRQYDRGCSGGFTFGREIERDAGAEGHGQPGQEPSGRHFR